MERHIDHMSSQMREAVAENLKERIYSTITLIALIATLWQHVGEHGHVGAVASIVGAAIALWLATLIAARMSYRAIHGKSINHQQYVKAFFTSSGLLAPTIPPILIITISGLTHWYGLKTALFASMVTSLLSLFLLSFTAGRKIYHNTWQLLLVSTLEMSVGIGVILLKLAVGE